MLAEVVLIGLVVAFRAKPGVKAQYISGEQKSEMKWIAYPHHLVLICDVLIIVAAVRVWYNVKQDLPPADTTVRIIAQQWAWTFVHPGPDNKLDTEDDIAMNDDSTRDQPHYHSSSSRARVHSFSLPRFA